MVSEYAILTHKWSKIARRKKLTFGSLQTIRLSIVGMLAWVGSVGVSDMSQVTCNTWHMTHDTWQITHDSCFLGFFLLFFLRCYYLHMSRVFKSQICQIFFNVFKITKRQGIFSYVPSFVWFFLFSVKAHLNLSNLYSLIFCWGVF